MTVFIMEVYNKTVSNVYCTQDVPYWKTVPVVDHYEASINGDIRNTKTGKVLKQSNHSNGYKVVGVYENGVSIKKRVHQLVAMAFLNHKPTDMNGEIINHLNLDRTDNRLVNLEVTSQRNNAKLHHIKSSSQYVGVYKQGEKWVAQITVGTGKGSNYQLGTFTIEYNAHLEYERAKKHVTKNGNLDSYDFIYRK